MPGLLTSNVQRSVMGDVPDQIGKLQIAEHHIDASLQMIAANVNAYSTHLIVHSCQRILFDLAKARGSFTTADHRLYVKQDRQKEWLKLMSAASNYFKHADKDHDEGYTGPSVENLSDVNEAELMMNIADAQRLGSESRAHWSDFVNYVMIRNPGLFKLDYIFAGKPEARALLDDLVGTPKSEILFALRDSLRRAGLFPT